MNLNLIPATVNISRVYEIAKVGNFDVKLLPCDNPEIPTTVKDLQILNDFYEFDPSAEDPHIIFQVYINSGDLISIVNGKISETLDDCKSRVAKAEFENKKLDTKLPTSSITLLKSAIEKLQLGLNDVIKIVEIAVAIAKLGNSDRILVEHVAEAIQYRSIKL